MTYTYFYSRHHVSDTAKHDTLVEAMQAALADLESGEAWPVKVTSPNGDTVWAQSGPLTTGLSLEQALCAVDSASAWRKANPGVSEGIPNLELVKGTALVLYGPEGCGKRPARHHCRCHGVGGGARGRPD